jgi:pimeloyl-ACP methyl ester carboxylesterase
MIWHGAKDVNTPIPMMRGAAEKLKGSESIVFEDETHMSVSINNAEEIIRRLLASGT